MNGKLDPYLPNDGVYLREISELEECEVITITDKEHVAQTVPPWAEINLRLGRANGQARNTYLRRSDGELIIECLREILHPDSQGVLVSLWAELDEAFVELKETNPLTRGKWENLKGKCLGLATGIAYIVNPYAPDVDAVRAEAVERWETA